MRQKCQTLMVPGLQVVGLTNWVEKWSHWLLLFSLHCLCVTCFVNGDTKKIVPFEGKDRYITGF